MVEVAGPALLGEATGEIAAAQAACDSSLLEQARPTVIQQTRRERADSRGPGSRGKAALDFKKLQPFRRSWAPGTINGRPPWLGGRADLPAEGRRAASPASGSIGGWPDPGEPEAARKALGEQRQLGRPGITRAQACASRGSAVRVLTRAQWKIAAARS